MSFWKQSPGPHWSHTFQPLFRTPPRPHIFQETFSKPSFDYVLCTEKHVPDFVDLISRHFTLYPRSKSTLSRDLLTQWITKEGCLAIGIYFNLSMVGCLLSRPLGFLMIGQTSLDNQQFGLIDYFCVNEKHRGKGIGSKLLHAMAYECSKRGYVAHLFLKEGLPLTTLPPLYSSTYIWRRRHVPPPVNLSNFIRPAAELPRGSPFWNEPRDVFHTKIFECFAFQPPVYVAITDLFHSTVPDKLTMGEVSWIWYNQTKGTHSSDKLARILETVVDSYTQFDMLFMDTALPHDSSLWTTDALYSMYVWNLHPGTFFKTRPVLTF